MLKIVVTITDFGAAANIGGDVIRKSEIISIPENEVPSGVKAYLKDSKWQTISFSILDEKL